MSDISTFKKIKNRLAYILNHKYLIGKVSAVREFCDRHRNCSYTIIEAPKNVEVTPVCYIGDQKRGNLKVKTREKYLFITEDVYVVGKSNVLYSDKTIIYDKIVEQTNNERITDNGLLRIRNGLVHFNKYYFVSYKTKGTTIPEAICLTGNFSGNLYHYFYEILGKFYIIDKSAISKSIPVLLDNCVEKIPQFKELADCFTNGRPILYIKPESLIRIQKCYYPSNCHIIPNNYKNVFDCKTQDVVFDRNVLLFQRSVVLNNLSEFCNHYPEKFFISRKSTAWRRYNEPEIIETINKHGFQVIYPEEMSYLDQVRLFRGAKYIIAASGAALTNMLFCKPGCKIVTLISARLELSIFSSIADTVGVDLKYLQGEITELLGVQSDFKINKETLDKYLRNGY